ncbi:MAG: flagellin FliC [Candidatus Dadabacteria bacterium]|nr:MAG: flagellin FliC [Candidatus Dadabacteria bacterium]
MRVATNVASLTAQRNLGINSSKLQTSIGRLSSGSRITSAKDDAAGLAISENLNAEVRAMNQAKRNTMDGISVAQTAEGGLVEIGKMLTRMKELATEAASDTVGTTEKAYLDDEFQALVSEIDRIANSTEFNGTELLDGTGSSTFSIQVGTGTSATEDAITIDLSSFNSTTSGLGFGGTEDLKSTANAKTAMGVIDSAIDTVAGYRGDLGAIQNRLQSAYDNLSVGAENLAAANSRIRDVDFAEETANLTANQVMVQAATSVLAQANQLPYSALSLLG